jgi:hypothetical protein
MMITVSMVDGQQVQIFPFKLTAALGADPAMDLEGLFAIIGIGWLTARFKTAHQLADFFN